MVPIPDAMARVPSVRAENSCTLCCDSNTFIAFQNGQLFRCAMLEIYTNRPSNLKSRIDFLLVIEPSTAARYILCIAQFFAVFVVGYSNAEVNQFLLKEGPADCFEWRS